MTKILATTVATCILFASTARASTEDFATPDGAYNHYMEKAKSFTHFHEDAGFYSYRKNNQVKNEFEKNIRAIGLEGAAQMKTLYLSMVRGKAKCSTHVLLNKETDENKETSTLLYSVENMCSSIYGRAQQKVYMVYESEQWKIDKIIKL